MLDAGFCSSARCTSGTNVANKDVETVLDNFSKTWLKLERSRIVYKKQYAAAVT
jgi:hypothetical protein